MRTDLRRYPAIYGAVLVWLVLAARGWALPAPGPLVFTGSTPPSNALVTQSTIGVQLDAACSVNPATLAVTLNGNTVPQASFLPFSSCNNGRMQSQVATVSVTLPNGTITGGPTSLTAGGSANYTGTGTGSALNWNFDGGSAPATGSPAAATFNAAGTFTLRLTATNAQALQASATDNGNLVTATRNFRGGDPTPDTRVVSVRMPAEVDFRNFESAHVHPMTVSESGSELYAVNTPEGRLSIFAIESNGLLTFSGDVPVGVDPVSLAQRPGTSEVWVVNHLSDNVSIVDVAARKVVATIAVGDEPTDIVFASGRAFVSLAGNQDRVNVYNASTRALVVSLSLFGDDPRALATNAAGTEVYAVVMESGNGTTALFTSLVETGGGLPPPSPPRNPSLPGGVNGAPSVGLIVKFNPATNRWEDERGASGPDWGPGGLNKITYTLPDQDLFIINASAATPSVIGQVSRIGTILYDVVRRPGTSELWVANTDARNLVRFEPNLRGHLVETRISKVNPGTGTVTHVDLNPHINFGVTPGSPAEIAQSISQPGHGVFRADGSTFYLTSFGSNKVAVLNGAGAVTARIDVGGGPSGVALKEDRSRLYVLNRFTNTISIVDTTTNTQIDSTGVAGPAEFDPTPDVIKAGRKFLYDATITSGHGDTACATCHVFSNFDNIAWDLGDPQGTFVSYGQAPWASFFLLGASTSGFDPMKGPMTTQTLRGLLNMEPFHWRGDRQNFQHFNGAFVGLMGMDGKCRNRVTGVGSENPCSSNADCTIAGESCQGLSTAEMNAYTEFIETVHFPPNPFRNLNNTMPVSITVPNQTGGGATIGANPNNGQSHFINLLLDAGALSCNQCHALPTGTNNLLFNGNAEGESQDFKIPHLRNMYEKVGFDVIRPNLLSGNGGNIGLTQQKRGYGFLHDGTISLTEFLAAGVFTSNNTQERELFAFMLAFPTESVPCIGWQQTVNNANKNTSAVTTTINTLMAQAAQANACDLIVTGVLGGVAKGYLYDPGTNLFKPDSVLEADLTESALRGSVAGDDVIVYTGVAPGAGYRLALDRDRDTFLNRTEIAIGTDPANPNSNPWQYQ
jgi:YVTN family beta-propeller protein